MNLSKFIALMTFVSYLNLATADFNNCLNDSIKKEFWRQKMIYVITANTNIPRNSLNDLSYILLYKIYIKIFKYFIEVTKEEILNLK